MTRYIALILAAGSGKRMKDTIPKQYHLIQGKPLLFYTLRAFFDTREIDKIALVIAPNDPYFDTFDWSDFKSLMVLRVGGDTRQKSLKQGIEKLGDIEAIKEHDWLITHDGVRCCLKSRQISSFIKKANEDSVGGILALPIADTIKEGTSEERILKTVDRDNKWLAQTPQMFRANLLMKALSIQQTFLDEASAIECLGYQPLLIKGSYSNIKVTYESDLVFAKIFLK